MAINLDKMRAKLSALDNKGGGKSSFWKPENGEQDIRIVCPSDGDPFKDFHFHYLEVNGNRKTVMCPKRNFDDECPICEFASSLWRDSVSENSEEGKKTAKGLFVKQRYFSPVLVRGEEHEGVRIWGYGVTAYKKLLALVLNPEYGDITDIHDGTDLTLTYGKPPGKMFPETDLNPRRRTSPLCNDDVGGKDRCAELLENIPAFDGLFERQSTQDVQNILDEFLADEDMTGDDVVKYNNDSSTSIDAAYQQLMNT